MSDENKKFDEEEAASYLREKQRNEENAAEEERLRVLQLATSALKEIFAGSDVEIFLVGSILEPKKFRASSDVDIVLKNFKGDRFETWPALERKIGRKVELILYENCPFQDHVDKFGMRLR